MRIVNKTENLTVPLLPELPTLIVVGSVGDVVTVLPESIALD